MREKIPDFIIERAVEIWCRALRKPFHDNGDNSLSGALGFGLSMLVTEREIAKVPDYEAAITKFREVLTRNLKYARDHEGEPTGETYDNGTPRMHFLTHHLSVDYHPDRELAAAAKEAGLPKSAFSIKSHVSFYSATFVSASFGYGAPDEYHHRLSDGRWVICNVYGTDMPKILKAIEDGILTGFEIEPAPEPEHLPA